MRRSGEVLSNTARKAIMETFTSVASGDVKNLMKGIQTEGLPKKHNQFGMSALCWSVELKQRECMETLLKFGADVNERNSDLGGKGKNRKEVVKIRFRQMLCLECMVLSEVCICCLQQKEAFRMPKRKISLAQDTCSIRISQL